MTPAWRITRPPSRWICTVSMPGSAGPKPAARAARGTLGRAATIAETEPHSPALTRDRAHREPNPTGHRTTRILAGLGYEALATTSAGLVQSLGRPDGEGAVRRDERSSTVVIAGATDLPVTPTSRTASATTRRAADDPRCGGGRSGRGLDRGLHPGRDDPPDSHAVERIGPRGETAAPAHGVHAHGARRRPCTAAATSTTRSSGCRPSRRRVPMCSTRRACATPPSSARSVRRSRSRSTRSRWPARPASSCCPRQGARRISLGSGFLNTALGAILRAAQGSAPALHVRLPGTAALLLAIPPALHGGSWRSAPGQTPPPALGGLDVLDAHDRRALVGGQFPREWALERPRGRRDVAVVAPTAMVT